MSHKNGVLIHRISVLIKDIRELLWILSRISQLSTTWKVSSFLQVTTSAKIHERVDNELTRGKWVVLKKSIPDRSNAVRKSIGAEPLTGGYLYEVKSQRSSERCLVCMAKGDTLIFVNETMGHRTPVFGDLWSIQYTYL